MLADRHRKGKFDSFLPNRLAHMWLQGKRGNVGPLASARRRLGSQCHGSGNTSAVRIGLLCMVCLGKIPKTWNTDSPTERATPPNHATRTRTLMPPHLPVAYENAKAKTLLELYVPSFRPCTAIGRSGCTFNNGRAREVVGLKHSRGALEFARPGALDSPSATEGTRRRRLYDAFT